MASAVVLYGGSVRRAASLTSIEFMHRTGFVGSFVYKGKKYIHCLKQNLRPGDINTNVASGGYYVKEKLLEYMVKSKGVTLQILLTYRFNEGDILEAEAGDQVLAQKLRISFPYSDFCKVDRYSWSFLPNELLSPEGLDLKIPQRATKSDPPIDIPIDPIARSFYNKNIQIVTDIGFPNDRDSAAYLITMIALYIHNIQKQIFPLFSSDEDFEDFINSQNFEWTTADLFQYPYTDSFKSYLSDISDFYNATYTNQVLITNASTENKLYWFASVLSAKSLAIMPASDKIKVLRLIAVGGIWEQTRFFELIKLGAYVSPLAGIISMNLPDIPMQDEEKFAIKVIESIIYVPDQSSDFLDRLLFSYENTSNNKKTLFEVLYSGLDDNRIKAYSITVFNDADNRMKFIELVFNIWQKSKYNPYYRLSTYSQDPVFGGVYIESFFLTPAGLTYYNLATAPPFIVYESYSTSAAGQLDSTFSISYTYKLNGFKIEVEKVITKVTEVIQHTPDSEKYHTSTTTEKYGVYHLFQPVTIFGFKPDLDIKVVPNMVMPIFYIYYMVQYSAIKYLDYGIILAVEVALNFTGIGELQNLKYLGYLKYISPMRVLSAEEAVLTWTAVQGVSDALVFTGANASATLSFIASTSSDPETRDAANSANAYLGFVLLSSVSSSYFLRRKVIESAINFTTQLDRLTIEGIPYIFDISTENIIRNLSNNEALVNSFTRSKLLGIPQGGDIVQSFDTFGNSLKYKFGKDYGQKSIDELALLKNNDGVTPMPNYKLLADQELPDAKSTSFLIEQKRVFALDKLVQYEGLKTKLYELKQSNRVIFLDHFGDQPSEWLNRLKSDPNAILRWEKLDPNGKLFAKNNPDIWLYRFDRLYHNIPKSIRLSNAEIFERFGVKGVDLVNNVEAAALEYIGTATKTQLSKRAILISAMVDKISGKASKFYKNFSFGELKKGGKKDVFLNDLFPNLKTRLNDIELFNKDKNYRLSDPSYLSHTGRISGIHAEIQALDDLAKQKFPEYLFNPPTEVAFNNWLKNNVLGYNRNIQYGLGQEDVIMHTCADCFHILDLVTFIRPL